jgi:aldose sugar dehydrogenase
VDTSHPPDGPLPANSPSISVNKSFLTGVDNPWDMAFLSDGTMFFTERPGPVKVRLPNGTINNIVTPSNVMTGSARGMLGIAVGPNFATNKFIYTCYTSTSNDVRLVRWQVNNTLNGVVDTNGTVLVPPPTVAQGGDHWGCRTRFGPDGKLWFAIGDGAVGTNPQNLDVLNGKTMRINGDGTVPADNPFVGKEGDDRIWSYGHRNQQGIAFRTGDPAPYVTEHGPDINDEVNKLVKGGNGGWNPVPNPYNQAVPMTDFSLPNAYGPVWRSGDSFTLAPSGATFLEGAQWKSWDGALLVAFLKDSKARVMFLDGSGNITSATPILEEGVRLRSAVQGPDGNLYIATDVGGTGGAIWKITPS